MKTLNPSQESLTEYWKKTLGVEDKTKSSISSEPSKTLSDFELRIGEYIRVSPTDELPDEGSLVNHPQRYREYVAKKNTINPKWGEISKTYVDKLMSAKDMNRPAFIQMCKDVKNGVINAIMCTELSRLSRSVKDFVQFWDFLKQHNVKLILVNSFIDTSDHMGEYFLYHEINNAQLERKRTIHRIRSGCFARANRGLTSGGVRILGYDPDQYKTCHLVVNREEVPYVNMIFSKFLELGSACKVVNYLNEAGYKTKSYITKKGGKRKIGGRWSEQSVHRLLTNLTYIGLREINKRQRAKDQSTLPDDRKYGVCKAQWPGIVDEGTFLAVQKMLKRNRRFARHSIHTYILTGLLECGECGGKPTGKSGNGTGGRYHYYAHRQPKEDSGRKRCAKCDLGSIPADPLENLILDRLKVLATNKPLLEKIISATESGNAIKIKQMESLMQTRRNELRIQKEEVNNLLALGAKDPEGNAVVLERAKALSQTVEDTEKELKNLGEQHQRLSHARVNTDEAYEFFQHFKQNVRSLTPHLQKEAVRSIVKRVIISKDLVTVELFCGYQHLLNIPIFLEKLKNLKDNKNMMTSGRNAEEIFRAPVNPLSSSRKLASPPIFICCQFEQNIERILVRITKGSVLQSGVR